MKTPYTLITLYEEELTKVNSNVDYLRTIEKI